MTLKKYINTLISPISPRRLHTSSTPVESPVSTRSPLDDLRDFWRTTFEESLEEGEEYREAALSRLYAQRGLLSDADVWDLQTMNDGLVVERDGLSDYAQSPEKLCFDVVSRASRYRSRAKSLYSDVRETVRRSQASLDSARARALRQGNAEYQAVVSRYPHTSDSLGRAGRSYSLSHRHESLCNSAGYDKAEFYEQPPGYDSFSSSSCDSGCYRDRHELVTSLISKSSETAWDVPSVGGMHGNGQASSAPGTNETICPRHRGRISYAGERTAESVVDRPRLGRGPFARRSTQSDWSEQSEFSPGPPTPHSSPQSSPPSADYSTSLAFLNRLDDALGGLSGALDGSEQQSADSFPMNSTPLSPSRAPRREAFAPHSPRVPVRATQSQLSPLPLPFRPGPDLRRTASQPQLHTRRPRDRLPVLFTKEDLMALRIMTSDSKSPISPQTDDDDGLEGEDLFTDDCTVETASVVVQPYGHSRANTLDRAVVYSPEAVPALNRVGDPVAYHYRA